MRHPEPSFGHAVRGLGSLVLLTLSCAPETPANRRGGGAVPVTVAEVSQEPVPLITHAIGTVEAKQRVAVRAQVGGTLTAVHFTEGSSVAAGDLLFTLDARPFRATLHAAEAGLARNQVLLDKAEEDSRRYAQLVQKGFVTQEQADQARATAASLAAAVKADEAAKEAAQLQLAYCTIRAPISGRAGQVLVDVGNLVKVGDPQPLVVILQTRPVDVAFSLPETTLPTLRAALGDEPLSVTATLPGNESAPLTGAVDFVDNAVDPSTGTLLLKAEFANNDGRLWPGQFVDIALTLRVDEDALVVPSPAVQNGREGPFVFVVKPDDTVEIRPIQVAREAGRATVVASGLEVGEVVVQDGQLRLKPGARIVRKSGAETPAP